MSSFSCTKERKKEAPFSISIGNWEFMQESFPKHSRMGTARLKKDKETDKDDKKKGVSMERNKPDMNLKKEVPTEQH